MATGASSASCRKALAEAKDDIERARELLHHNTIPNDISEEQVPAGRHSYRIRFVERALEAEAIRDCPACSGGCDHSWAMQGTASACDRCGNLSYSWCTKGECCPFCVSATARDGAPGQAQDTRPHKEDAAKVAALVQEIVKLQIRAGGRASVPLNLPDKSQHLFLTKSAEADYTLARQTVTRLGEIPSHMKTTRCEEGHVACLGCGKYFVTSPELNAHYGEVSTCKRRRDALRAEREEAGAARDGLRGSRQGLSRVLRRSEKSERNMNSLAMQESAREAATVAAVATAAERRALQTSAEESLRGELGQLGLAELRMRKRMLTAGGSLRQHGGLLSEAEVGAMADGLQSAECRVHRLWLVANHLTDAGAAALAGVLATSRHCRLAQLHLRMQSITDVGAAHLAAALESERCE